MSVTDLLKIFKFLYFFNFFSTNLQRLGFFSYASIFLAKSINFWVHLPVPKPASRIFLFLRYFLIFLITFFFQFIFFFVHFFHCLLTLYFVIILVFFFKYDDLLFQKFSISLFSKNHNCYYNN